MTPDRAILCGHGADEKSQVRTKTRNKSKFRGAAIVAALVLCGTGSSACSSLEAYSARAARQAGACQGGWPTEDGPLAYPGDPEWPFEHGLCKQPGSTQPDVASVGK
jgi:hypothetical protein